jgi:hypothetical protein
MNKIDNKAHINKSHFFQVTFTKEIILFVNYHKLEMIHSR